MTAAVFRNTPPMSVPQTQNTAPVLEFNCLYTHDVRKKTKKWQDGVLRYHTFNKRVMVYDVPRNFIGDMHWTGHGDLHEGDEVTLERSGVTVEVADCIGRSETDLSELRKSKNKSSSAAATSPPSRTAPIAIARASILPPARANTQLKHQSLNTLLGTPKGPIGKAQLPSRSPFEEKHANDENEAWEDGWPPKRPKTGDGWNVTRTTTTSKSSKRNEMPLWARTSDAAKQKKRALPPGQQKLGTKEVIALSDDENDEQRPSDFLPGFSDDALANSSSPAKAKRRTTAKSTACSSSPAFQTQKAPDSASRSAEKLRLKPAKPSSRAKSNVETTATAADTDQRPPRKVSTMVEARPVEEVANLPKETMQQRDSSSRTGHTLRLASTAPKKRGLLCQDQLLKKSKRPPAIDIDNANVSEEVRSKSTDKDEVASAAREKFEARLARIDKKGGSTSSARLKQASKKGSSEKQVPLVISSDNTLVGNVVPEIAPPCEEDSTVTVHRASALELGRLDDLVLPPLAPVKRPTTAMVDQADHTLARPPAKEERSLRKVNTDPDMTAKSRRIPGAPVRYTPSPTKRSRESTPAASRPTAHVPVPHTSINKAPRSRRPLQKSVSLNVTANGTSTVILGRQFKATSAKPAQQPELEPAHQDFGPWSRDAFDLFTWRPPGWNEKEWRIEKVDEVAPARVGLSGGVSMPS
ncbi:uncharacterized protein MYCFIDRAFT_195555 [Pseudocercospora fijiensis CIRAD86]|uniref:5'-3' DNA helicase ZGRF1-like N-terminal domain-containing protein n=1 Tax=Pseudocercospora fijiensis (strain CIRAD86) TaxID=383855 RepID=M3A042_PSEFD|nr:uncharacterized protein MYCFIDRAFT_195555 [Pseudocercospora fijiensis CIRAD86]EME84539.1 hypothetical protein MYCFIDRAFT_195555 [Pseudocercospora fijiensis CIRAD86]